MKQKIAIITVITLLAGLLAGCGCSIGGGDVVGKTESYLRDNDYEVRAESGDKESKYDKELYGQKFKYKNGKKPTYTNKAVTIQKSKDKKTTERDFKATKKTYKKRKGIPFKYKKQKLPEANGYSGYIFTAINKKDRSYSCHVLAKKGDLLVIIINESKLKCKKKELRKKAQAANQENGKIYQEITSY